MLNICCLLQTTIIKNNYIFNKATCFFLKKVFKLIWSLSNVFSRAIITAAETVSQQPAAWRRCTSETTRRRVGPEAWVDLGPDNTRPGATPCSLSTAAAALPRARPRHPPPHRRPLTPTLPLTYTGLRSSRCPPSENWFSALPRKRGKD